MLRQCPAQKVSTAGYTYNQRDQGNDHLSYQGTVSVFCVWRGHSCMHEMQQELHSTDFFHRDWHGKRNHWIGEENVLTRDKNAKILIQGCFSGEHLAAHDIRPCCPLKGKLLMSSWEQKPLKLRMSDDGEHEPLPQSGILGLAAKAVAGLRVCALVREPTQPCMYIHMYKQAHTKQAVV